MTTTSMDELTRMQPTAYPSLIAPQASSRSIESSESSSSSSSDSDQSGRDDVASTNVEYPLNKMYVSRRFIVCSIVGSMLIAFAMGRALRVLLIDQQMKSLAKKGSDKTWNQRDEPMLASLIAERVPRTRYTSKNFDTSRSVTTSSWLIPSHRMLKPEGTHSDSSNHCEEQSDECETCEMHTNELVQDDEGENYISGEHLSVDIKHVDGAFLNSESRLSRAIIDLVNESDLTLLSYHCHGLSPSGVSCAGVLLRNYIAFHTWPEQGVITFDLVATETSSLLPLLSVIQRLFGVPQTPSYPGHVVEQPETLWSYDYRGFRNAVMNDLENYLLSDLGVELKEEVASVKTDFQRIDVYDVMFPHLGTIESYKKSLKDDESYEARNEFMFRPDRVVFLDGWIQSTLLHEAAYHEALVHPALFTHPNPKRVAIIGGGEGATLREVLKHNTVDEAVMIEIDEEMVTVSRDYLPEWNDCSDLAGSTPWCVNDPRATVYYEDALKWFMDRYSADEAVEGLFDVIILDALDPESEIPIAKALYGNDAFMKAFFNALSNDGILVMQLGEAPEHDNPDETHSVFHNRATTTSFLENIGFESIHVYEEAHCGFRAPWTYVIAFKSSSSRAQWYAGAAAVDVKIRRRSVSTMSGKSPFHYFDGATMVSYQVPHRLIEAVFCRKWPTPKECLETYEDRPPALTSIIDSGNEVPGHKSRTNTTFKFNPVAERHRRHETTVSELSMNALSKRMTLN